MSRSDNRLVDAASTRTNVARDGIDKRARTEATSRMVMAAVASTPSSLFLGILASLLVALFADSSAAARAGAARAAIWGWWLCVAMTFGSAILICHRFTRGKPAPERVLDTVLRGRAWSITTAACAVSLGSASWLLMPGADQKVDMLVIAFMIAMSAAHTGSQASYPPLMVRFQAPSLALFTLGLWRLQEQFYLFAGVGFVIFGFGLYNYATVQARHGLRTIELELQAKAERRQADEARLEADRANQAMTAFLSAASHDLRQPMHALIQYQYQLQRRNTNAQLLPIIEQMGTSIEALQALLDVTLDVSKLTNGAIEPVERSVRVGDIVETVGRSHAAAIEDKGLILSVRHDATLVRTDGALLERMLQLVLSNAIRYTARGKVGIRSRQVGKQLVISIFDTGTGISREQREKIFEPYYQIDNDARNRSRGVGLGLTIVLRIANLLSIGIKVRSKLGKGSVFRLSMPVLELQAPRRGVPESGLESQVGLRDYARGATVVLIEDDPDCLRATEGTLGGFGCQVISGASAEEALRRLRERGSLPDLIISDYRLDAMTGLEAIALLRSGIAAEFGDTFNVQALLISGDTAPAELQRVASSGLTMLQKPTRPHELYAAVNAELELLARNAC